MHWEALLENLAWFALGCIVGTGFGFTVRAKRDAKEALDKVNGLEPTKRNEGGFMRNPITADIAMLLVVGLTVYASFQAGLALNKVDHTVTCIKRYNVHQGEALSARDSSIKAGTQSEIKLWTQYGELYAQAKKDPSKIPAAQEKLNQAIASHRLALIDTQETRDGHPYADPDILRNCDG